MSASGKRGILFAGDFSKYKVTDSAGMTVTFEPVRQAALPGACDHTRTRQRKEAIMTSPQQWMSGDYMGPANSVAPETAKPDLGEANSAVAASGGNRDGHGVLDVPNMSNAGTHMAGGS